MGKTERTKMTWLPMCGFMAELVEHRIGIRGGLGFEYHSFFFTLLPSRVTRVLRLPEKRQKKKKKTPVLQASSGANPMRGLRLVA